LIILYPSNNEESKQISYSVLLKPLLFLLFILPLTAGLLVSLNKYGSLDYYHLYLPAPVSVITGYLWVFLSSYFKNINNFVSNYCSLTNVLILIIISSIQITMSSEQVYLISLLFLQEFIWFKLFFINVILLIINNLIFSRYLLSVKLASIQSFLNIIFFSLSMVQLENLNVPATNLSKLAMLMLICIGIPQVWLTAYRTQN
jgi:hypothetical protein